MTCSNCLDLGWVCENHHDKPWSAEGCECGAGMPCPVCNTTASTDRDALNRIKAYPINPPEGEIGHFIMCQCGQAVDQRRLGDVVHHAEPGHAPLPVN